MKAQWTLASGEVIEGEAYVFPSIIEGQGGIYCLHFIFGGHTFKWPSRATPEEAIADAARFGIKVVE